jgi:hypothetical protein
MKIMVVVIKVSQMTVSMSQNYPVERNANPQVEQKKMKRDGSQ